jgi:hypothetical protein
VSDQGRPLVAVGDVITIPDPDDYYVSYRVVTGILRMRVIQVTGDTRYAEGKTFIQVMGVTLKSDGSDGPQTTAVIRVAALIANPPKRPATDTQPLGPEITLVHPVAGHTPIRPMWICRTDAQPWPCADARLSLIREYRRNRTDLASYLATTLATAMRDLHTLNPDTAPDPVDLDTRFLSWLPSGRSSPGKPDAEQSVTAAAATEPTPTRQVPAPGE